MAKTDCIEWRGPISRKGYGTCRLRGRATVAHRAVYTLVVADRGRRCRLCQLRYLQRYNARRPNR